MPNQTDPSTITSNSDVPFAASIAVATGTQEDNAWDGVSADASVISILKALALGGPVTSSFSAYAALAAANATGDGTEATIVFNTKDYDSHSDYNNTNGVFTAPVSGNYFFGASVDLTGVLSTHTQLQLKIKSNAPSVRTVMDINPFAVEELTGGAELIVNGGTTFALLAGQTVTVTVTVSNGSKVVGVSGSVNTRFYGWRIPG